MMALPSSPAEIARIALRMGAELRRVRPMLRGAILAVCPFMAALAAAGDSAEGPSEPKSDKAQFVGSQTCVSCHAKEFSDWKGSQHHAAMQEATDQTVLGDFNGATFSKDGVESTFFKKDGKFWVRTDGPDGTLADFFDHVPSVVIDPILPMPRHMTARPASTMA